MTPIVSFVGRSNVGKTTYLEKLIAELKRRHWRVAVIKHDVHGFEIDRPGKDTWRHAQAGADVVCIAGPTKLATIVRLDRELPLSEVAARLPESDIVLTEGYKREGSERVEVFRSSAAAEPLCLGPEVIAVVSDVHLHEGVPHFGLDDPGALADFLAARFAISKQ